MSTYHMNGNLQDEDSVAPDAIISQDKSDGGPNKPSSSNATTNSGFALPSSHLDVDRPHEHHRSGLLHLGKKRRKKRRPSVLLHRTTTVGRRWWKFHFREWDDEDEEDWWMASTGIPLLSATLGPLANVLSIAALVTSWRMCLVTDVSRDDAATCVWDGNLDGLGAQLDGQTFPDPRWCYWLNAVSLIAGFVGNFFLLCNFTNRIRYIIALPVTIVMWLMATGILIGIIASMAIYVPPVQPQQIYTQGFWYAVIAACMYMICSMLLMINMLGYFLGHYPQHFTLTDSQRTLILQTMMFFIWLAGGAALFWRLEMLYGGDDFNWSYVNSLYFCDVTILTVGFGDLYPTNDVARGMVFPYSVGGIIMLGLMASSITKFARELGAEKVVQRHIEHSRARTWDRSKASNDDQALPHPEMFREGRRPTISSPMNATDLALGPRTIAFADDKSNLQKDCDEIGTRSARPAVALQKVGSWIAHPPIRPNRNSATFILREERDRFNAMRKIQENTARFKNWYALCLSVLAFGLLWAVGAVIFWQCEKDTQGMTYFEALYFCYVSLLTIGYGDLAPQSNAGRPFFVFWSLIAVPTMTILISDLSDTVVKHFKKGTSSLADFTVLPQKGIWREFLDKYPWLLDWLQRRRAQYEARRRLEEGFQVGPEPEAPPEPLTIDELVEEQGLSDFELAQRLVRSIKRTALHAKHEPKKRYSYEEWVEFMRLIKFTAKNQEDEHDDADGQGMIDWDWIGEDSPMMAGKSEAEFVLDRLCESMTRYVRRLGNATDAEKPVPGIDDEEKKSVSVDRNGEHSAR